MLAQHYVELASDRHRLLTIPEVSEINVVQNNQQIQSTSHDGVNPSDDDLLTDCDLYKIFIGTLVFGAAGILGLFTWSRSLVYTPHHSQSTRIIMGVFAQGGMLLGAAIAVPLRRWILIKLICRFFGILLAASSVLAIESFIEQDVQAGVESVNPQNRVFPQMIFSVLLAFFPEIVQSCASHTA